MATIVKDLGAVTAYAYAKEKGYTGTEDEFAELMASYADVAEQAADSAAQAVASATAAEQAKANAASSASAAASSASTASTKASEAASSASSAAGSANTATTKANEASTSATNAASSASAAATSATNAGASATAAASLSTAASNAQAAAETAQGKAEDAQTAAEDAAASVSESAAQITQNAEDIADLKSALEVNPVFNDGFINGIGDFDEPSTYAEKYTDPIGCVPGQKFEIAVTLPAANGMWVAVATYDKHGVFVKREWGVAQWIATFDETFTVPDGIYSLRITYRTFNTAVFSVKCLNWSHFMMEVDLPPAEKVDRLPNSAYAVSCRGINHTGWHEAPENTLPAFEQSKKHGFSFVECDLQLTSDNVPVILHDWTINRTARNPDGSAIETTINVHDTTYEDLLQYDFGIWKGQQYAGTKIPTLEEFLILCKKLNLHPYIEIKGNGWNYNTFSDVFDIVKKYGMESRVTWISFSEYYLKVAKASDVYARLGYIVSSISAQTITTIGNLSTPFNTVFIDADYANLSGISLAIDAQIPVESYTVNNEPALSALPDWIDGVTSDYYNYPEYLVSQIN